MQKISSQFFMIALLTYYIPKALKMKKSKYIKIHIVSGIISIIFMISALISKIGHADFLKYCGFSSIMMIIGVSGGLIKKRHNVYLNLHRTFTVMFFIYLILSIKLGF